MEIFEVEKPESAPLTLPNTAFVKSQWAGADVYCLPTNTPESVVKDFWHVVNMRQPKTFGASYYGFEILMHINQLPELGFESEEYYCDNGVDGWYIIGNLDFYEFLDASWSANHDYWILSQDQLK